MRPTTRRMLEVIAAAALLVSLPSPAQGATSSSGGCISSDPGRTARAESTPRDTVIAPGPASGWSLHPVGEGHPAEKVLGMAVTGTLTASVVWQGDHALRVALTTDGGATWPTVIKFADPGTDTSISMASSGRHIDILMTDQHNGRAIYRRSDDAGLTWTDPVLLGKVVRSEYAFPTAVIGRAPDGTVAAAWWWKGSRLVVKVSHDGGSSFGFAHTLARWHPQSGGCAAPSMSAPMIALGRGVIVVAGEVVDDAGHIGILRSLDGGLSWSKPAGIGYLYRMVAHGKDVLLIGYGLSRVSHDRGLTWSRWHHTFWPDAIAWSDGRWRAALQSDFPYRQLYRDSIDGIHWSAPVGFAVEADVASAPAVATTLNGRPVLVFREVGASPSFPGLSTLVVATRD